MDVMDELFAPPVYEWKRLSPSFRSLRRLTTLIFIPIVFVIPAILVWVLTGLWWVAAIILALAAVILLVRLALIGGFTALLAALIAVTQTDPNGKHAFAFVSRSAFTSVAKLRLYATAEGRVGYEIVETFDLPETFALPVIVAPLEG